MAELVASRVAREAASVFLGESDSPQSSEEEVVEKARPAR